MEIGSRIKAARIEAGLSQRQLSGAHMTRNMLSQIENGSAHPSMKTLRYLAEQLGKPVSYFLEEEAVIFPNQQPMADARAALALGDLEKARQALDMFLEPDAVFYEERQLLEYLWHVRRAQRALAEGMTPYAVKLLFAALELDGLYITQDLRYRCRVLLGIAGEDIGLESDDEALLVRARQCADPERRLEILGAAEDKSSLTWNLLFAHGLFALKRYAEAAQSYLQAPQTNEVYERLEICYRELGDYKRAYEYACRQRQGTI